MLLGINPTLPADVVNAMMSMGHGDAIAFVDSNFPAASVARSTGTGEALSWAVDAAAALTAVVEHFPIDTFQPEIPAVQGMQVVDAPDDIPAAIQEVTPLFQSRGHNIVRVERMDFYARARTCFVIVQLMEHRPYGNFILRKGVVGV